MMLNTIERPSVMYNINQQQLIDLYIKQCSNFYPSRNVYPYNANVFDIGKVNTITIETGFMRLHIINSVDKTPVNNATITIYVTDGIERDIPIIHLITTLNPVRLELPMANDLGTQIVGPEYKFSTYSIRVDAFGYFANIIYNIRLFPNTTTDFEINLVPIRHLSAQPAIEERVDIPPHPRDEIERNS